MPIKGLPDPADPQRDAGVSEVIGVVLLVAITVAIAATVYIWAGGFGETGQPPESASATAKVVSLDNDRDGEWIKLTLTSGNGPYDNSSLQVNVASSEGSWAGICDDPQTGTNQKCTRYFGSPAAEAWEVGSSKWFPCQGSNPHSVTLALEATAVLDRTVDCEEAA